MPFDPSSGAMDVILGLAALATLVSLARAWSRFWDGDFTSADRRLATQIAVFLIPPIVVLLHEGGHVLAAVVVGADVLDFSYGLFEGSVTIAGGITPAEDWTIALAGNLVGVLTGLMMVVAGVSVRSWRRPLRYVLVAGGLLEIVFTLVMYPALSLVARFGDWTAIYDVDRTPGLSWATAVLHALSLLGLWMWWRRRGRAVLFGIASGSEAKLEELEAAIRTAPMDIAARLALADFYARRGELALARSTLDEAVAECGEVPRLHLGRARLGLWQGRWNDVVMAARRGLQGDDGDEDVRQKLWANLALALTEMQRPDHALAAYEHLMPPVADDLRVRYGRGLVRLESGDTQAGRLDLEAVVTHLPEGDLLRRWAQARLEGHPLEEPPDPNVPAYARSDGPPPAPIAGV
ncbi:MAG: M50 family metallopeptidase [Actinobacteria bacterium]|nr:M50 family metallopeptidase [Actinomycetota bacterium]